MTTRGVRTQTEKHKNKYSAKEQHGNNEKKDDDGNMQMREGPGARKKGLEVRSCSFFFEQTRAMRT